MGFNGLPVAASTLYLGNEIDVSILKAIHAAQKGEVVNFSEF